MKIGKTHLLLIFFTRIISVQDTISMDKFLQRAQGFLMKRISPGMQNKVFICGNRKLNSLHLKARLIKISISMIYFINSFLKTSKLCLQ